LYTEEHALGELPKWLSPFQAPPQRKASLSVGLSAALTGGWPVYAHCGGRDEGGGKNL